MNRQNKFKLSVIVGHYGNGGEVYKCLDSLGKIKNRIKNAEFILVDNNEEKTDEIKRKYKWVKYIKPSENLGWGKAKNLGLKYATGDYLLILDSDMVLSYKSFAKLYNFIKTNKKAGLVAPKMINISRRFTPSGTRDLTPFVGIVYLSFLNKLFNKSPIIRKFLMMDWDRKKTKEVGVAQLGTFMMKRKALEDVGGFDENIFLYFEENDLGMNLKKKGWKEFVLPEAEVLHLESKGTPKETSEIKRIFRESRFYYFKKHYGFFRALVVEFFARMSKKWLFILMIILLGAFLRFYRFMPNFIFNGEMGTDYMNIWNIIHGERTFLIGPRTSHEWFFISPITYWIYTGIFLIWKYNPIAINIFWGVIGVSAIPVCYFYIKKLFDNNVALISSFLLAVSPAWIAQTRASRYNPVSAILFFPYLFYLKKSIEDKGKSLLAVGLILGLTMSFFPSPLLLIPAAALCYVFYRVRPKIKYVLNFVLGFVIPNITFLIYEVSNKFTITTKLIAWIPYRVLGFFGAYPKNNADTKVVSQNFYSIYNFFTESFGDSKNIFSVAIFLLILAGSLFLAKKLFSNKTKEASYFLLIINLVISFAGLFIHGNPPEHYYLVIFPIPLILTAYLINKLFEKNASKITLTILLGISGIFGLLTNNWFWKDKESINYSVNSVSYATQQKAVDAIVKDFGKSPISIARVGENDKFENNFANNYIFLLTVRGVKIEANSKILYTVIEGEENYEKVKGTEIFSERQVYVFKNEL